MTEQQVFAREPFSDMSQMLCFCSTLDNAVIDLERISNLLRLYCEHIESEYGSINPDEPWTAKVFLNRLPICEALFDVIEDGVNAISGTLSALNDEMYKAEIHKNEK